MNNRVTVARAVAALSVAIVFIGAVGAQQHRQRLHEGTSEVKVKASSTSATTRVQFKVASWPNELRAGDCGQQPGTLTIGSDGSLHWEAVTYTYSTHSGDIWHTGLTLLDKDGVTLGSTGGWHDSPRMNDGNGGPPPKYRWTFDYRYDASTFSLITSVREGYKC